LALFGQCRAPRPLQTSCAAVQAYRLWQTPPSQVGLSGGHEAFPEQAPARIRHVPPQQMPEPCAVVQMAPFAILRTPQTPSVQVASWQTDGDGQ
jgi:hypothetical protein